MKRVEVNGREGNLVFEDRPWVDIDGKPADVLVRVKFTEKEHGTWFRKSEVKFL